jgi:hypothetical protein
VERHLFGTGKPAIEQGGAAAAVDRVDRGDERLRFGDWVEGITTFTSSSKLTIARRSRAVSSPARKRAALRA